ncbi:MAG TPA: HAD-IA family hydrolase [Casimicrobiaceae bacterium]|nr:HAD-IA family hydrolase [Casimicrobiaceae bacterium]
MHEALTKLDVDVVLFDLDGTLADTAGDLAGALNRMRRDRGLADVAIDLIRPHASSGARGMLQAGMGVASDAPDYVALRDEFLRNYEADLASTTRLFDGIAELLDDLESRGFMWGIVTNKAARYTIPVVAALGIAKRARTIVSGDTTPRAKPDPAPLLHAAREIGVAAARCVYVGDDLRDVIAGNAAGMPTLVARWGYLGSAEPHEQWPAVGGVDAPADILAWLAIKSGTRPR